MSSDRANLVKAFSIFAKYQAQKKEKASKEHPDLPKPSAEQQAIIDAIGKGQSVKGSGQPGAGKTTNIFQIAREFPHLQICQITFNKKLKLEVRAKADKYNIPSLNSKSVHTYHSFAKTYYNEPLGHTDEGIRLILKEKREPAHGLGFDLVIFDEVQDMRELLCVFAMKILEDVKDYVGEYPQLMLLGDENQGVYEFLGSRAAFLTHAKQIFTTHQLVYHNPKTSFRLTRQMAEFFNRVLLGENRIVAVKDGPKVGIITQSKFTPVEWAIAWSIWRAKKEYNLRDDEIAILAPSLYNKSGMREKEQMIHKLENILVHHGHNVYYPTSDDSELDEKSMRGKITFCAYPSSKGCEWKYVCVIGVEGEYFDYFGKDLPLDKCPSAQYVAMSRASLKLVIVCNGTVPPYFKVPRSSLFSTSYSALEEGQKPIKDKSYSQEVQEKAGPVSVRRLCMYIPDKITEKLMEICADLFETIEEPGKTLKIKSNISIPKSYVKSNGDIVEYKLWEYVADKTGDAILHLFDLWVRHNTGSENDYQTYLEQKCNEIVDRGTHHKKLLKRHTVLEGQEEDDDDKVLDDSPERMPDFKLETLHDIIAATCILQHYEGNTISSPTVIDDYSWIPQAQAELAIGRLAEVIDIEIMQREITLDTEIQVDDDVLELVGRIDVLSGDDILEIKCTNELGLDAKLQIILYRELWTRNFPHLKKDYYLYNVKTGEKLQLIEDKKKLKQVLATLIDCYYDSQCGEHPSVTVENVHKHRKRVLG